MSEKSLKIEQKWFQPITAFRGPCSNFKNFVKKEKSFNFHFV